MSKQKPRPKPKAVRSVKGPPEPKPGQEKIQVIPGNMLVVVIRLLSEILDEVRKVNGGPK
jgi:hypothetical protein